jgi:5-methylcytosine-specific restriction endonuclease McrA
MENKKWCSKCKEWKDLKEFNKASRAKDGLKSWCKSCSKKYSEKYYEENNKEINSKHREYYEKNQEKILLKNKIYRQENKEEISLKSKEYYYENKKELNLKVRERSKKPVSFTSTMIVEIGKYEEVREASNGNLECKCTYCGSWFEPNRLQVDNRLQAINNSLGKENKLYCSKGCKVSCPIFGQKKWPKNHKPHPNEVDPELRKMVLARDEYYCQRCGKHKSEVELHCHHITGKTVNPIESHDMDNCVTFCKACHLMAHKEKGCTYYDLRCPSNK